MVALGWYFQIELFQGNGVKHYWVTMWNGVKTVTNGPKQVGECVNSVNNLSIHCIARNQIVILFNMNEHLLGINGVSQLKIWIEKVKRIKK